MNRLLRSLWDVRPGVPVLVMTLGLSGLLSSAPAAAQITSANVGLKGGLNLSTFYGEAIGEAERLNTTTLGVFVQLDFAGQFSLQPEINFSKRGAKEDDLMGDVTEGVWAYNYFDVVALLEYHVGSRRSSPSLSVFAGPVFSFLGSAQATAVGPEGLHVPCGGCAVVLMSPPVATQLQHETNGTDFGGTIGMGLTIGRGAIKFILDARYSRMMSEFDQAPYNETYSRKHNALSFQVGLRFSPSAWAEGPQRASLDEPPEQLVVVVDRIRREAIAARDGTLSLYDIIRLERPGWMEGEEVRATLFVDGQPWNGSPELLQNRRGSEVEEIRRIGDGADGIYQGHGVVIEIISR